MTNKQRDKAIEVLLREFAVSCFKYKEGKIDGTDLGMDQVLCVVLIKKLFTEKRKDARRR